METAQLQEATGDLAAAEKSYAAVVAADPNALLALRGLARVAEARGDLAGAKAHWAEYTKKSRAGDAGWFQGEYQQARLEVAAGDKKAACKRLDDLRPAMPALTDADMRKELTTLYDQACNSDRPQGHRSQPRHANDPKPPFPVFLGRCGGFVFILVIGVERGSCRGVLADCSCPPTTTPSSISSRARRCRSRRRRRFAMRRRCS